MHLQLRSSPVQNTVPVIALHCSGSTAGQWRELGAALDARLRLVAPEHYGCENTGPWSGEHAFALADEAERTIQIIDQSLFNVHLVGHSYGGAVAMRVAVERPNRIASLSLYEPVAFHILRTMGARGAAATAEIRQIAALLDQGVVTGDYRGAVIAFVDYWSGKGAWAELRPPIQAALKRWAPKGPLDFRALIDEPTPVSAYASLDIPTLILRGEHALGPSRSIAETLASLMPAARMAVIPGAGHMGPITHSGAVNLEILRHIAASERTFQQREPATSHPAFAASRAVA